MDNRASSFRRTPTNPLLTIEGDARWFQIAVKRNLLEEAAEIVFDWVEDGKERQPNPSDNENLADLDQIVAVVGIEAAPFLDAFAACIPALGTSSLLAHWRAPTSPRASQPAAGQNTTRDDEQSVATPIEQACQAVCLREYTQKVSGRISVVRR